MLKMNMTETETASHDMDSMPDQYKAMHTGQNRTRLRNPIKENVNAICPIGAFAWPPNIFRNITLNTA